MKHVNTSHDYAWEIDFSDYADEWFEIAEDRHQYEDAVRFVTGIADLGALECQDVEDVNLTNVHYSPTGGDSMRAKLSSSRELGDNELQEARESLAGSLPDAYIPRMGIIHKNSAILKQGLTYEINPESLDLSTDPEWEGPVMQRVKEIDMFDCEGPDDVEIE